MSSNWDDRWMATAVHKGSFSKDRSRKIGAVIVNGDAEVSNGWNGFPRKVNDDVEERHQRPAKYLWCEHSERNALYNAARMGRATMGCRIYQTMYPCAACARGIIQCGIVEVITVEPDWDDLTYKDEFEVTKEMLAEAGVRVRFMEGETPPRAAVIEQVVSSSPRKLVIHKKEMLWSKIGLAIKVLFRRRTVSETEGR